MQLMCSPGNAGRTTSSVPSICPHHSMSTCRCNFIRQRAARDEVNGPVRRPETATSAYASDDRRRRFPDMRRNAWSRITGLVTMLLMLHLSLVGDDFVCAAHGGNHATMSHDASPAAADAGDMG